MPRRPTQPRYFASRKAFFVQIAGVQHKLAEGPEDDQEVIEAAWAAFHTLMASAPNRTAGDTNTVLSIANSFLKHTEQNMAKATFIQKQSFLKSFVKKNGNIRVCDLKRYHVEDWLSEMKAARWDARRKVSVAWNSGTCRTAITAVMAALNWARENGYTSVNPLKGLKKPPALSRSAEAVITDYQHKLFLAHLAKRRKTGFADLLVALYETGARPGEMAGVTAGHYKPELGAFVIGTKKEDEGRNKTKRFGKPRIVYVGETLRPLVEKRVIERPTGPLFPAESGKKYFPNTIIIRLNRMKDRINKEFEKRGEATPFQKEICSYGYRHRWATNWLLKGGSPAILAELLGTSISVIQKSYGHLTERPDVLRKALLNFEKKREEK